MKPELLRHLLGVVDQPCATQQADEPAPNRSGLVGCTSCQVRQSSVMAEQSSNQSLNLSSDLIVIGTCGSSEPGPFQQNEPHLDDIMSR